MCLTQENVCDLLSSFGFRDLVITRLAPLFSCEGKVKTGRLQSVIGHVTTPPQGVGSAWGKDLAPPERPGVKPGRAVPGSETDTQRPLSCLPPPSAPLSNSFEQQENLLLRCSPMHPRPPTFNRLKKRVCVCVWGGGQYSDGHVSTYVMTCFQSSPRKYLWPFARSQSVTCVQKCENRVASCPIGSAAKTSVFHPCSSKQGRQSVAKQTLTSPRH